MTHGRRGKTDLPLLQAHGQGKECNTLSHLAYVPPLLFGTIPRVGAQTFPVLCL